jgi:FkbM family methyltransferase
VPLYIALSDKTTLSTFNYSDLTPGVALHALGIAIDNKGKSFSPVYSQLVLSMSLDDLVEMYDLEKPNHLKIDVDGVEYDILRGANNILSGESVKTIIIEMEPLLESSKLINELLVEKGFMVSSKHRHGDDESSTTNYIFVRK